MRRVRLRRKSVLINLTLATAMVTGAGFAYAAVDDGGGSSRAARTRTGKVTKGTVLATVSASGSLSSPSDVGVGFTAAGKVTTLAVKVGDTVTAGQVLAQIDPTQAQEALDAAKAAVTVAQANLTKARAGTSVQQNGGGGNSGGGNQGTNAQNTVLRGSTGGGATSGGNGTDAVPTATSTTAPPRTTSSPVTQPHPTITVTVTKTPTATPSPSTTVDAAAVSQAESALITANNKLADAQRALDGCVLKAPSAGIVASVSGKVGDTVSASGSGGSSGSGGTSGGGQGGSSSASSSSTAATGFVVIANPTGMETRVSFPEADAAKVKAGQPATVTLNVNSAIRLNAKVVSVNPLPDSGSTSGSVKYGATIALEGDVSALRTGQTANISVVVAEADNALQVPSAAVSGTGATASVRVLVDGVEQRRTVTAGVVGDQTTQIVSGLAEGDEIVIGTVATTGGSGSTSGRSGQSTRGGTAGGGVPAPGVGNFPGGGAIGGGAAGGSGGGVPRGGSR
ncbi:efflux RND transporter periplasmic adaptor subunit [Embleya scabrispora]|uniref:efflux RND transporter periplasmic adaptor subunit n=1 Tax=Embleya scabrispora TaxID=159449 RepID=UPI00037D4DC1|nr:HlyD family efflux transporter periplasmic adaptor subunit [Embleya scabrispora]MYS83702.1 HlyD family efflux transporter periplasmic adaptor subunit [Streptomyces sp. SID5474]